MPKQDSAVSSNRQLLAIELAAVEDVLKGIAIKTLMTGDMSGIVYAVIELERIRSKSLPSLMA